MRTSIATVACCAVFALLAQRPAAAATVPSQLVVRVDAQPSHRVQIIHPLETFGSTVDKEPAGSIPRLYSKANVDQMLAAGWGWLSYRLFTELSDQDWHWNPLGSFSAGDRGYWTSSASIASPLIDDSFGYRLPMRGNESDQGNNEDYSRLDDGDDRTYWKSDPYLAQPYTGDPDSEHPQWVVIDLGAKTPVNAVRVDWVDPYAVDYQVSYWTGDDAINDPAAGRWVTFPHGTVTRGAGGHVMVPLGAKAGFAARFVRVLMTRSSNTCDSHGTADRRNCLGYAIAEIGVGTLDEDGTFQDAIRHAACAGVTSGPYRCRGKQTAIYTSSTDPWHTAADRVVNQEQPGLDLIARSGLTRGIGAMYPVPMLYSTPQNAVNEIRYMRARGYAVGYVELGEEPDGQYTTPEDDAALYAEWAKALHDYDPSLKLGGPVLSGVNSDLQTWPDARGDVSWLHRYLAYLRAHRDLDQLSFMSFEHYPFLGCEHGSALSSDLVTEPSIMKTVADAWRADGLPASIPMYVTEANFTFVNFSETPMLVEGALWQADYMASALSDGVSKVVYYQYEPVPLSQNSDCPADWGNLTMFAADSRAVIHARTAQFDAALMINDHWVLPGDGAHGVFRATTDLNAKGGPLVTAYGLQRPDATWSVMLINKTSRDYRVKVRFDRPGGTAAFDGPVTQATFGEAQYAWKAQGAASHPDPNDPPAVSVVHGPAFELPALSITVFSGRIR